MKAFAICAAVSGLVFFAAFMQLGGLNIGSGKGSGSSETAKNEKKAPPRAKFPQELAPAAQAKPVEKAAEFKPGPDPHKLVFMTPTGELHPWQEDIPEAWQADTVEETELVIVVGSESKIFVDRTTYPGGEPPINRFIFEVEVSVVEAKTGKILDNRMFRHLPDRVNGIEEYATTVIGRSVHWALVYRWVSARTHTGFPHEANPLPVEVVVR
jgi:hypothetical protein